MGNCSTDEIQADYNREDLFGIPSLEEFFKQHNIKYNIYKNYSIEYYIINNNFDSYTATRFTKKELKQMLFNDKYQKKMETFLNKE